MPRKPRALFRAFTLLWGRLGVARRYVAIGAGIVLVLAVLGVWHIVSWAKQIGSFPAITAVQQATPTKTPEAVASSKAAIPSANRPNGDLSPAGSTPSPTPTVTPAQDQREITITDISQTKKRGRMGETLVVAKIGIASRSDVEKGDVEIRISFYDLTPDNELVPTDAQVTYQWLTTVRDWSDPTPKYLAATYLQWPRRDPFFARVRYAGVVVRVYARGKLQDERSEPEKLRSMLRTDKTGEPNFDENADLSRAPRNDRSPVEEKNVIPAHPPKMQATPPTEKKGSSTPTLPYGKPVPGKPGFVSSPYDPKFTIDVRGFPPGTLVNDPNTNKPFRVP